MINFLKEQGINNELINGILEFRKKYSNDKYIERIPTPHYKYYGKEVWEQAISAILQGSNILLTGPKATGKNVLCDNLALLFERPTWNISFHVNTDSSTLVGTDTFVNNQVSFRPGPVYDVAINGGFGILDEVNMAKNDSVAVIHSSLDHRRIIDIPGYDKIKLDDATRFIGTMNYGYAGTRELNEALISRFLIIDMPMSDKNTLENILKTDFDLTKNAIELFTKLFLDLQEKSLNSEISSRPIDIRGLIAAIGAMKIGLDIKSALKIGIVNKTFDNFEKEIIQDEIDSLFSNNLTKEDIFIG
ncbi:AAA family ATPase [Miniphocaeibacter massiliensis]|uniref:AAA family ATPase n=1 Tax=Miniphocaeibacter massiliensis TaxID=2041841 RepID=UPI000C068DD3|nr:AAA family ATPase [Miniphocaeibacter massiliensis]